MKLTREEYAKLLRTPAGRVFRGLLFAVSMAAFFLAIAPPIGRPLEALTAPITAVLFLIAVAAHEIWLRLPSSAPRPSTKHYSRSLRRAGVIAFFTGLLTVFAMFEWTSLTLTRLDLAQTVLFLAGVALLCFGVMVLGRTRSFVIGALRRLPDTTLDERELQLRQMAFALTCQILVGATTVAGFASAWAELHNLQPFQGGSGLMQTVLLFIGSSGTMLPTAIVAWIERDEPVS